MNKSGFYGPVKAFPVGFLVCAALFTLGCVAGVIASGSLPIDTPVNEYVAAVAGAESGGFDVRFLSALQTSGKYHAVVMFFAFSVLGVIAIPAVSALRGFLLCFAVSSVIRYYGAGSVPYALLMFAPEAIIAVPALFLLSTHSLSASGTLLQACSSRGAPVGAPYGNGFTGRVLICAALVCITALIDAAIGPWLTTRFVF